VIIYALHPPLNVGVRCPACDVIEQYCPLWEKMITIINIVTSLLDYIIIVVSVPIKQREFDIFFQLTEAPLK
jgi:hypothetical protein